MIVGSWPVYKLVHQGQKYEYYNDFSSYDSTSKEIQNELITNMKKYQMFLF